MVGVATLSTAIPTAAERAATSLKRCRAVVRIRAGSVVPARGRMIARILILAALTCRVMSDASTPRDAASLALKAMLSKSSKVPAIVMSSEILVSKLPPGGSGGMLGGCGESGGGKHLNRRRNRTRRSVHVLMLPGDESAPLYRRDPVTKAFSVVSEYKQLLREQPLEVTERELVRILRARQSDRTTLALRPPADQDAADDVLDEFEPAVLAKMLMDRFGVQITRKVGQKRRGSVDVSNGGASFTEMRAEESGGGGGGGGRGGGGGGRGNGGGGAAVVGSPPSTGRGKAKSKDALSPRLKAQSESEFDLDISEDDFSSVGSSDVDVVHDDDDE